MSAATSPPMTSQISKTPGLNVPWNRLAGHYRTTVDEIQNVIGEPHRKREPADAEPTLDLWRVNPDVL